MINLLVTIIISLAIINLIKCAISLALRFDIEETRLKIFNTDYESFY
ncbi:MAG: hypothetical protein U0T60_00530 [Buchnera aphidicola (Meitanaphis microgallis)]